MKKWVETMPDKDPHRHSVLKFIVFISLMMSSFLFIGPVIHEFTHMLVLEIADCYYTAEWFFSLATGLSAGIQPYCYLESSWLLAFYLSGYSAVLLLGGFLSFLSLEVMDLDSFRGIFTGSLGAGLLLSLATTIALEGDVTNALEVLNAPTRYGSLLQVFVLLGASATSLKVLQHLFDISEWED